MIMNITLIARLAILFAFFFASATALGADTLPSIADKERIASPARSPDSVERIGTIGINVSDIAKSVAYYTDVVGMKAVPQPSDMIAVQLVQLSFTGTMDGPVLLLSPSTYLYGNTFGGITFKVRNLEAIVKKHKAAGYKVKVEPWNPYPKRSYRTLATRLIDPNGHDVELIQIDSGAKMASRGAEGEETIAAAGINISDMPKSVAYFTEVIGMKIIQRLPDDRLDLVRLSFSGKEDQPVLMLAEVPNLRGNTLNRLTIKVNHMEAIIKTHRTWGYEVSAEPKNSHPTRPIPTFGAHLVGPGGCDIKIEQIAH